MKIIDFLLNLIGWMQIVAATSFIGLVAGLGAVYFNITHETMMLVILTSIGFVTGAVWATRIWIKHGTVKWLSGIRRVN